MIAVAAAPDQCAARFARRALTSWHRHQHPGGARQSRQRSKSLPLQWWRQQQLSRHRQAGALRAGLPRLCVQRPLPRHTAARQGPGEGWQCWLAGCPAAVTACIVGCTNFVTAIGLCSQPMALLARPTSIIPKLIHSHKEGWLNTGKAPYHSRLSHISCNQLRFMCETAPLQVAGNSFARHCCKAWVTLGSTDSVAKQEVHQLEKDTSIHSLPTPSMQRYSRGAAAGSSLRLPAAPPRLYIHTHIFRGAIRG